MGLDRIRWYMYTGVKDEDKPEPTESAYSWAKGFNREYNIYKSGVCIEKIDGMGNALLRLDELRKDEKKI